MQNKLESEMSKLVFKHKGEHEINSQILDFLKMQD